MPIVARPSPHWLVGVPAMAGAEDSRKRRGILLGSTDPTSGRVTGTGGGSFEGLAVIVATASRAPMMDTLRAPRL